MIRLFLLLLLLYLLYRFTRGVIRIFQALGKAKAQAKLHKSPPPVVDKMVLCSQCGAYIPSKVALSQKGLYFCDQQCQKAFRR